MIPQYDRELLTARAPHAKRSGRWPVRSVADRLWERTDVGDPDDCWLWQGSTDQRGYGNIGLHREGRRWTLKAYRVAYVVLVGPIPEGLQLDHLCRQPRCVNPNHLEPVTQQENQARGRYATATHCIRGHPFDAANTYRRMDRPRHRMCRACKRIRDRGYSRRAGSVG